MNSELKYSLENILKQKIISSELIQSLWSGYGSLLRIFTSETSFIIKHIQPPSVKNHPRGWNTNISHQRKLTSYEIESAWYQHHQTNPMPKSKFPKCIHFQKKNQEAILILEDLKTAGFPKTKSSLSQKDILNCLSWLAEFHTFYLNKKVSSIWETGSYWHLDTRPDELNVMKDSKLKKKASLIDHHLNSSRFKTIIHGDAKAANFCFSDSKTEVAAVDFQYVGYGPGVKDVAYFLSSCLDEYENEKYETFYLDHYFKALKKECKAKQPEININALETDWRKLYPFAWTDFVRFLMGWCPDHFKIHRYSKKQVNLCLDQI